VTQLAVNFAGIPVKAVFPGSCAVLQGPGCGVFELLVMEINASFDAVWLYFSHSGRQTGS